MPRPRKVRPDWATLATIWEVSDALWAVLEPLLAKVDPPKPTGRRRMHARPVLDAILFRQDTAARIYRPIRAGSRVRPDDHPSKL